MSVILFPGERAMEVLIVEANAKTLGYQEVAKGI